MTSNDYTTTRRRTRRGTTYKPNLTSEDMERLLGLAPWPGDGITSSVKSQPSTTQKQIRRSRRLMASEIVTDGDGLRLPLAGGKTTRISVEDADLADAIWTYSSGYAVYRHGGKRPFPRLHRVIVERMMGRTLAADEEVDHIDGDTLNNRRGNLRVATRSGNSANKGPQSNNTTGFKGVYWHKRRGRWTSAIKCRGVTRHLGYFDAPEDAARAYDKAAVELFGEYAKTNAMLGLL